MILCVLPVGIEIRHEFFIPNFKIFYILYQKCFTDTGNFHIVNDNFVCSDLAMSWTELSSFIHEHSVFYSQ